MTAIKSKARRNNWLNKSCCFFRIFRSLYVIWAWRIFKTATFSNFFDFFLWKKNTQIHLKIMYSTYTFTYRLSSPLANSYLAWKIWIAPCLWWWRRSNNSQKSNMLSRILPRLQGQFIPVWSKFWEANYDRFWSTEFNTLVWRTTCAKI